MEKEQEKFQKLKCKFIKHLRLIILKHKYLKILNLTLVYNVYIQ